MVVNNDNAQARESEYDDEDSSSSEEEEHEEPPHSEANQSIQSIH